MDDNSNLNPATLADAPANGPVAAAGEGTVETPANASAPAPEATIKLSELKDFLGKDFKDVPSALKSIKDTYSYVGKAGQKKEETVSPDPSKFVSRDEFEREMFYKDNPALASQRELIDGMAKANGVSPREAIKLPAVAKALESIAGFEKSQSMKSVLESNPRLAQVGSKMSDAQKLAAEGKTDAAASLITKAVLEAYAG